MMIITISSFARMLHTAGTRMSKEFSRYFSCERALNIHSKKLTNFFPIQIFIVIMHFIRYILSNIITKVKCINRLFSRYLLHKILAGINMIHLTDLLVRCLLYFRNGNVLLCTLYFILKRAHTLSLR